MKKRQVLIIKKIKVASAEIVVHGTVENPYYEIKYYDIDMTPVAKQLIDIAEDV